MERFPSRPVPRPPLAAVLLAAVFAAAPMLIGATPTRPSRVPWRFWRLSRYASRSTASSTARAYATTPVTGTTWSSITRCRAPIRKDRWLACGLPLRFRTGPRGCRDHRSGLQCSLFFFGRLAGAGVRVQVGRLHDGHGAGSVRARSTVPLWSWSGAPAVRGIAGGPLMPPSLPGLGPVVSTARGPRSERPAPDRAARVR